VIKDHAKSGLTKSDPPIGSETRNQKTKLAIHGMKNQEHTPPAPLLMADSQTRLLAYTTAAGLGAFFACPGAEAQVTASAAFASYPQLLIKGSGTGYYHTYHYLDIDGDGVPDFNLNVDNFRVNIDKQNPAQTNLVLNPSANYYVIPWTNGVALNATDGSVPTNKYGKWLASDVYHGGWYFGFDNFETVGALGFSFTAGDGRTHYGYINIQVNTQETSKDFTATVTGIYYNATPDAPITIGALPASEVMVTNIQVGAGNVVTIDFTSSDDAAASTFTLQTSLALGAAAVWTADTNAVITSSTAGVYQAVTTAAGGPAQFYRISH
jgi:hypothetical protein